MEPVTWTPVEFSSNGNYSTDLSGIWPFTHSEICCATGIPELYSIYDTYVPLWEATTPHFLCGIRSQMNICNWRLMLNGGPERVFGENTMDTDSYFLMDGLIHGFKLVDPGAEFDSYLCENYKSASVTARVAINEIIIDELASGKLSVVQEKPYCVHALGAVLKPSGGYRPITDASRPESNSINAHMNDTFHTFSYKTIDMVSSNMSKSCFMAVTDITSAYRSILVRPCDRLFQGLKWQVDGCDSFIQDNFLSFGTRVSPFLFNRLTEAIARYVSASGFYCVNYLDDFLVMGGNYEECREAQLFLHATLRNLGFYIAYAKVRSPLAGTIIFRGRVGFFEYGVTSPSGEVG